MVFASSVAVVSHEGVAYRTEGIAFAAHDVRGYVFLLIPEEAVAVSI